MPQKLNEVVSPRPAIGTILASAAVAAALTYVLDRDRENRLTLIRDKIVSWVTRKAARIWFSRMEDKVASNVRTRMSSFLRKLNPFAKSDRNQIAPEILNARVWAHVGGLVPYSSALQLSSDSEGIVTVTGPILGDKVDPLLREISSIPGVKAVKNRMERRYSAEQMPASEPGASGIAALGGAIAYGLEHVPSLEETPAGFFLRSRGHHPWSLPARLIAGTIGGALTAYGVRHGRLSGKLAIAVGGVMLLRSTTNLEPLRVAGLTSTAQVIDVHNEVEIGRAVEHVFGFWTDFKHLPHLLEHVYRVEDLGNGLLRWRIAGPGGIPLTLETITTRLEPNKLITWRTVPESSVAAAGFMLFEAEHHRTRVEVELSYNPPGGILGHAVAWLTGTAPERLLAQEVGRTKSLLEKGTIAAA